MRGDVWYDGATKKGKCHYTDNNGYIASGHMHPVTRNGGKAIQTRTKRVH